MERPGDIIFGARGERLRVTRVTPIKVSYDETVNGEVKHKTTGYVALDCEPVDASGVPARTDHER